MNSTTHSDFALELSGVAKSFGAHRALNGLEFQVPRGSTCGLIGPNGAGKTTTFSIIGGFVKADAGQINVLGDGPFQHEKHRGRLALLPQDSELNPNTPIVDLLSYYAELEGMTSRNARRSANEILERVGLKERRTSKIRELSHGMRRRVATAQAFLGQPELILLDEPTSGLDPDLVVRMRELFLDRKAGSTLIVSSHVLAELESYCDYVVFMESGKCVRSGSMESVTKASNTVRVRFASMPELKRVQSLFSSAGHDHVKVDKLEELFLFSSSKVSSTADMNALVLPALLSAELPIDEVLAGHSLEAAYLADRGR